MWIGERLAQAAQQNYEESAGAEMGVTTIGGDSAAVMTQWEERNLPIYGPGGLLWLPKAGDTVLVIKGGSGRSEGCVAAAAPMRSAAGMSPGEICLFSDGASIVLHNNGRIDLNGQVYINGVAYESGTGESI